MEEKIYTITQDKGGYPETVKVKESELTESHKSLLQGEFIKQFLDLPKDVQVNVINALLFE